MNSRLIPKLLPEAVAFGVLAAIGVFGYKIYQSHLATVAGNAQVAALENGAAVPPNQLALDYTGSGVVSIPGIAANPYTGVIEAQSLYPQLLDPYTQSPGTVSEIPSTLTN